MDKIYVIVNSRTEAGPVLVLHAGFFLDRETPTKLIEQWKKAAGDEAYQYETYGVEYLNKAK